MMIHLCGGKPTPEDMREVERFASYLKIMGERMRFGDNRARASLYASMEVYGDTTGGGGE